MAGAAKGHGIDTSERVCGYGMQDMAGFIHRVLLNSQIAAGRWAV